MLLGVVYRIIVMIFEERENVSEIIKSFLVYLVIVDNSFEFFYFYFFQNMKRCLSVLFVMGIYFFF